MTLSSVAVVLLGFFSLACSTSPPDYSHETKPLIYLDIINLEPARGEITYGENTIPATAGFIELKCDAKYQSIEVNYGPDVNATMKWVLPNPQMLTEGRAHEKEDEWGPNKVYLAITDFKPEDAGDYTCQLYLDGKETEFKKTIAIPDLDGSPILKCDKRCKQNEDDDCQLLEYAHVYCDAYGFDRTEIYCNFEECATEEICNRTLSIFPEKDPFLAYFGGSASMYVKEENKAFDEFALKSGRFNCRASNHKGQSFALVPLPVSAGILKKPGLKPPPLEAPINEESKMFIGKTSGDYHSVGDKVQLLCWTNENVGPIEWAFYNASTPNVREPFNNIAHTGFELTEKEASGGVASELVIWETNLECGGVYECSATNKDDGTRKSVRLVIETYRWAEDADMNQDRHVTAKTGSTVTMRCTITTTAYDPQPRWYKDGQFVRDVRATKSEKDQVLTITDVTQEDSGVYTCKSDPRFHLGVDPLEGKTTLTVSDTAAPADQLSTINDAMTSLFSVQQSLMSLSNSIARQ